MKIHLLTCFFHVCSRMCLFISYHARGKERIVLENSKNIHLGLEGKVIYLYLYHKRFISISFTLIVFRHQSISLSIRFSYSFLAKSNLFLSTPPCKLLPGISIPPHATSTYTASYTLSFGRKLHYSAVVLILFERGNRFLSEP